MRSSTRFCIFASITLLIVTASIGQTVQFRLPGDRHKSWQRVITGTDSNIDVDTSSLILEPDRILRAKFRTILSKSEESFEKPGVKYKTRIETIQFDSAKGLYRIIETTLLDSSEKQVFMSEFKSAATWRKTGETASRLLEAASQLSPLGSWRIVNVRYASGHAVSPDEDAQLAQLFGSDVGVRLDRFWIARDTCLPPSYESVSITADEFSKLIGRSMKEAGFDGDKIDVLRIKCDSKGSASELHVLFRNTPTRSTLLSGGVLIDIERH